MRTLAKLAWTEVKLFLRDPLTVLFSLALPLIILFVLAGIFGSEPVAPDDEYGILYRGVAPTTYYLPAYLALVVASVCVISLPTHIAGNRDRGVLKRFHASGVPVWVVAGAEAVVSVGLASVNALLLSAIAVVTLDFDAPRSPVAVLGSFLLVAVAFAAFGVLLGAVLPTARAAQAVGILLWFVMLMLGGAGPPPETLTSGMRFVSEVTPLWHSVQVLHQGWLGVGAGFSWLVVVGLLVVSSVGALGLFRWE
jgi:ABC-2 type transport system permease protein